LLSYNQKYNGQTKIQFHAAITSHSPATNVKKTSFENVFLYDLKLTSTLPGSCLIK